MRTRIEAENVKLKRVYESPSAEDGTRILVERLWSRGIKKADAAIDQWARGISPSTELRKWFAHDPDHWQEFRRRYAEEVREHPEGLSELRALARQGRITLVFSAHDENSQQCHRAERPSSWPPDERPAWRATGKVSRSPNAWN